MSADPDRPLVLGLRARLVLALVLTAALTLAVAAVTLLGPLERRLRNQAGTQLESAAQTAALRIDELRAPPQAGGRALRPVLIRLRRRADAEATVVDARGRILATTDRTPGEYLALARAVARSGRQRRLTAPTDTGDEVVVAVPLSPPGPQLGLVAIRPLDAVRATARSERRAFTVAAAVGLAVAIAVGVLLAERLARRLRRLRAAALRLVELGPEVEFVPDQHRDEVGELSRAFAHVQAGINRQERARRTFVATASHELRTPLTTLDLMLDSAAGALDPAHTDLAAARDEVHRAQGQSRRLSALAAQLLDLSRIDAGVPLREEPVDLRELCRAALAEFVGRAAERDVELEIEGPRAWSEADPDAVARIVRILLDNALRASPAGGRVTVAVAPGASVTVTDDGPGVPPEEAERIFRRFERGADGGGGAGFGLGLAIGRELAERMGGVLALAGSERGAAFALALRPAASPAELGDDA